MAANDRNLMQSENGRKGHIDELAKDAPGGAQLVESLIGDHGARTGNVGMEEARELDRRARWALHDFDTQLVYPDHALK